MIDDRKTSSSQAVRSVLRGSDEIALIDVREEHYFAQGHPLWAANVPLSRLEAQVRWRIPRFDTPIVVYGSSSESVDDRGDLATMAIERLLDIGYSNVSLLEGGLSAWTQSGGELFTDVNVPSKAFGELVEHTLETPSLSAIELEQLILQKDDVLIVDVRTYAEFHTMSVPGGVSLPVGEAVFRIGELIGNDEQTVIVNCAGRTRSIIGTQSLINAGLTNPVFALRNGTMGMLLAGQRLNQGATTTAPYPRDRARSAARRAARQVAYQAGVTFISLTELTSIRASDRTVYVFDTRTPDEYDRGHLPYANSAPGGQLLQETDWYAPVRGALIVLIDDDGVRANMAASWLAQMGWQSYVLVEATAESFSSTVPYEVQRPVAPAVTLTSANQLEAFLLLSGSSTQIIDVSPSSSYKAGHIPGAWYVLRSRLIEDFKNLPQAPHYVITSGSGYTARFAAKELEVQISEVSPGAKVSVLDGGNDAWVAAGYQLDTRDDRMLSPVVDRFARPYNGINAKPSDMQAYLDWELELVAQLERDGTHKFGVLKLQP